MTTTGRPGSAASATSTTTTASAQRERVGESTTSVTNPTTHVVVSQPAPQQEGQAGEFGQTGNGWYSYNLGDWHLISLNIECADEPGGCIHDRVVVRERDQVAGSGPKRGSQPVHARLLAPADVQLDGHAVHLGQRRGTDGRRLVEAAVRPPRDADPQWPRPRVLAVRADGSRRQLRPAARDPRVHHRDRRRVARHGAARTTPNLQAWADQYYGVMKLRLAPDGYTWDYESAMESPTAPAGTPPTYSDKGAATCNGGGGY